jgi:HSP20 family protein
MQKLIPYGEPARSAAFPERHVMSLSFNSPFDALFALQRALDSRLGVEWGSSTAGAGAYPPINVFAQGDDFVAVTELPGVHKNDLQLEAKENTIRIFGKKAIDYGEGASLHRRERVSGVFDRTLSLPVDINPDGIRAEYRDGVLALSIPRAESQKPRAIKIA